MSRREEMPGCSSKSQSDSGTAAGPSGAAPSASENKGNLGKKNYLKSHLGSTAAKLAKGRLVIHYEIIMQLYRCKL